jgi:hypothetical protein
MGFASAGCIRDIGLLSMIGVVRHAEGIMWSGFVLRM